MHEYERLERSVENSRWTPLHKIEGTQRWLMRCACGTEKVVEWRNYRSGRSLSCGCYRREVASALAGTYNAKPPGESARNHLILVYKRGAEKRGYSYDLTVEEFTELTSSPCHYCGALPSTIIDRSKYGTNGTYVYNGIDRKNPNLGYTPDNCVTACKTCNYAKRSLSYVDFIKWIDSVVKYQSSQR